MGQTNAAPSIRPREVIAAWREQHWPPPFRRLCPELPVFTGSHSAVAEWAQPLAEAMAAVSGHLDDVSNARIPRWMAVPKVRLGVTRVNLAQGVAKASRRFSEVPKLLRRCGPVPPDAVARLEAWLAENPGLELVAHAPFHDMRAYLWCTGEPRARRVRFYASGLVIAPPPGAQLVVQDHRRMVRAKRSDAYADPICTTALGWTVFGGRPPRLRKKRPAANGDKRG